jgi:hypothetical protein
MNPKFLIIIFIICCFSAAAQPITVLAENGIYISDKDFTDQHLQIPFNGKDAKFKSPLGHFHELWIKTKDSTYKFYDDDIWGYRQTRNDYRLYKSEPYKILCTEKIIIYKISPTPDMSSGMTIFFSKGLTDDIHELTRKKLIEVYHTNNAFIQKLKKEKSATIFRWNKEHDHYQFIEWLQKFPDH